jgi:hypothetical protein
MDMRYSRISKKKNRNKYAIFLLITQIVFLLIYILSAGTLGKMVSKLILPILSDDMNDALDEEVDDTPLTLSDETGESESSKAEYEKITDNLKINPLSIYTIQMGAFTDENNAKGFSEDLKSKGGAGYVHFDGYYRVLAVGFQSEEDAVKVRDELKADGIESNIYKIVTKGAEMQITAAKENVELIRSAFESWEKGYSGMEQILFSLDTGAASVSDTITKIRELKDEMEQKQKKLEEINAGQKNIILNGLTDLYKNTCMSLENIIDVEFDNKVAISSEIKYTYIDLLIQYRNYLEHIS